MEYHIIITPEADKEEKIELAGTGVYIAKMNEYDIEDAPLISVQSNDNYHPLMKGAYYGASVKLYLTLTNTTKIMKKFLLKRLIPFLLKMIKIDLVQELKGSQDMTGNSLALYIHLTIELFGRIIFEREYKRTISPAFRSQKLRLTDVGKIGDDIKLLKDYDADEFG